MCVCNLTKIISKSPAMCIVAELDSKITRIIVRNIRKIKLLTIHSSEIRY